MKMIVAVVLALVAVAAALPVEKETETVKNVVNNKEQTEEGYNFGFENSDGQRREEKGELKEVLDEENKPHLVVAVRGLYTYVDEEGNTQTITYEADENGYRANGPAVPKN